MLRVSVIIPAHNAVPYIAETLESVLAQELKEGVEIELSIRDDGSTDGTLETCQEFLRKRWTGRPCQLSRSEQAQGPGAARNAAVAQSTGYFLCFCDADDVNLPQRVQSQLDQWLKRGTDDQLVGARFERDPPDATWHYASFLNNLNEADLVLKGFRELTLIQTTWFMSRTFFKRLGGYQPVLGEDLELFLRILEVPNVHLSRCDEVLVIYRHISGSVTSKTPRKELVRLRARAFERQVLCREHWAKFTVWGAGRDGRTFYESLSPECQSRIIQFVDVSENKIKSGFRHSGKIIPVRPISKVTLPFVVCVAMGRTGGELEANVAATGGIEGHDYWHFN